MILSFKGDSLLLQTFIAVVTIDLGESMPYFSIKNHLSLRKCFWDNPEDVQLDLFSW